VVQPLRQDFRIENIDADSSRNLADILAYAELRCSRPALAKKLAQADTKADVIASFLLDADQSGGKFLYAVRVLNDLESGVLSPRQISALPPGMDGFYLEAFGRRFPDSQAYEAVRALLGILAVEREPVSRDDLASALGKPDEEIDGILSQLEDFLAVSTERVTLNHASLSQWLTERTTRGQPRAGKFAVRTSQAKAQLAAWVKASIKAQRAHKSQYLARHVSAQLDAEERKELFPTLLLDFRWLYARCRFAGLEAVLRDLHELPRTSALSALSRALTTADRSINGSLHMGQLQKHVLATQLLSRLGYRPEAELASLLQQASEAIREHRGLHPISVSMSVGPERLAYDECSTIQCVVELRDGRIASSAHHPHVTVWDPRANTYRFLEGHDGRVGPLAALQDGNLISGSDDCSIKLWNLKNFSCEATLPGHKAAVTALVVLSEFCFASGSADGAIMLWDRTSGKCIETLAGHEDEIRSLLLMPDGRMVSTSADGAILSWSLHPTNCERTIDSGTYILATTNLPTGKLAIARWTGDLEIWCLDTGHCEAQRKVHGGPVLALAALPDGRIATSSANPDYTVRFSNFQENFDQIAIVSTGGANALAMLSDGRLALGGRFGEREVWEMGDLAHSVHAGAIESLVALPGGRMASASRAESRLRIWHQRSRRCEETIEVGGSGIWALAVLPGWRVALGMNDGTIQIWDLASRSCITVLNGHVGAIFPLAVLKDGRLLSGGADCTIKMWDPVGGGACIRTFHGHMRDVSRLVVLTDGRFASAADDFVIRIWHPDSATCEAVVYDRREADIPATNPDGVLTINSSLPGFAGSAYSLVCLANGQLVSGHAPESHILKFWDSRHSTCQDFRLKKDAFGSVWAIAELRDGLIVTASRLGTLFLWKRNRDSWHSEIAYTIDAMISSLLFDPAAAILVVGDVNGRLHWLSTRYLTSDNSAN
jgi:WD40 repeat protein